MKKNRTFQELSYSAGYESGIHRLSSEAPEGIDPEEYRQGYEAGVKMRKQRENYSFRLGGFES